MNAIPVAPLPAASRRAGAEAATQAAAHGDLDARILQAEQRLVEREDGMRRNLDMLTAQIRQRLQPRRLLLPAVGAGVAVLAIWWLNRLRRR